MLCMRYEAVKSEYDLSFSIPVRETIPVMLDVSSKM